MTKMMMLVKPQKKDEQETHRDTIDIKTEIAIAKFEQGFVVKTRRAPKRSDESECELVEST